MCHKLSFSEPITQPTAHRTVGAALFGRLSVTLLGALLFGLTACGATMTAAAPAAPGKTGSMARFAVKGGTLYALTNHQLLVFTLSRGEAPQIVHKVPVPTASAETLFIAKERLFIGARDGMAIFDIRSPKQPTLLGQVRHFRSCDPVVVQGTIAYLTLRTDSADPQCSRGLNALQVYDVSNPHHPRLIKTYPMKNPWGLGIDGDRLFVADGEVGLMVFDAQNPLALKLLAQHPFIRGYDVIPNETHLIVSAADGLYQFDYRTRYRPFRLHFLSRLPIGKPEPL